LPFNQIKKKKNWFRTLSLLLRGIFGWGAFWSNLKFIKFLAVQHIH